MSLPDPKDVSHGKMTTIKPLTMKVPMMSLSVVLHVVEDEAAVAVGDVDEAVLQVELEVQLLVCKSSFQPL